MSRNITRNQIPLAAALLSLLLGAAGCQQVAPWERGTLARPEMALDADPLATALKRQQYDSKEAAAGDANPAGAGCGCN